MYGKKMFLIVNEQKTNPIHVQNFVRNSSLGGQCLHLISSFESE